MDHLRRQIPNLFPLLGCLPSNIWVAPLSYDGIEYASLARAITPADLERFQRVYAHRVQAFWDWALIIPFGVSQALSFAFHNQPIFPNLVELKQTEDQWGRGLYEINMLLGPYIRRLTLSLNDPAQASLLPILGKKYPALLQFNLAVEYSPDVGHQMNHILPGWTQLQSLTVPHLPEESLRVVATLPHLFHLVLAQADSKFGDTFSPTPGRPVFPVLRELSVTANTLTLCINLLRATTNCPLEEFAFYLYKASTPAWHDLFSTLAESCNKTALTVVRATDRDVSDDWETPGTTDQLQPLLLFTNLTDVCLGTRYGFNVDDAFLREMATAWPHLQYLDIGAIEMRRPIEQQRLTLQGLAPLAEFCPDLQVFTVNVDATHSCFNHINLGSTLSTSCVDNIMVDHSPISQSSVPWAAAYLSGIFPKLRAISWIGSDDGDDDEEQLPYPKRWSEVTNHLAAYRHIRGYQQDKLFCRACS